MALSMLSLGNFKSCKFLTWFVIDSLRSLSKSLLTKDFNVDGCDSCEFCDNCCVFSCCFFFFSHPNFKLVWLRKSLIFITFLLSTVSKDIDFGLILLPIFVPSSPTVAWSFSKVSLPSVKI